MKTRIGIISLLLLITAPAWGTPKADSLLNVLETQKPAAKEKLSIYESLYFQYITRDLKKAQQYAEEGLKLANKEGNDLAISLFNGYIGRIYGTRSSFDTSLVYWNRSLDFARKAGDSEQEVSALMGIGNTYGSQNEYDKSVEYFLKALPIADSIGSRRQRMQLLGNLGVSYRMTQNYDGAEGFLLEAAELAEELGNKGVLLNTLVNLQEILERKGEWDKAGEHALQALALSREIGDRHDEFMCLHALVMHYGNSKVKQYDKALECAEQAWEIAEEIGEKYERLAAHAALSKAYLHKKRYREAEQVAVKGLEIDSVNYDQGVTMLTYAGYANLYLGNSTKAAEYFDRYVKANKLRNSKRFEQAIANMEVKYETEKKEMRIATLEREKELYIWLGVAGGAILLLILGLLLFRHRLNLQKRRLAEQQVLRLEQEKRLVATQAVLDGETAERSRLARDLHDGLGGMLSVVKLNLKDMKGYSIMDAPDVARFNNALQMLDESIGELRRVAHHMMPDSLMRYGLRVSLEDFCRAIPGARFQYLGEDPRLDSRLEVLIYRCTYELVNNAVKYAGAENINVQLMVDGGVVSLTVQDDGVGFDMQNVGEGSGLDNIRTRVAAYNGKVTIHSAPGEGTEISIEIEPS